MSASFTFRFRSWRYPWYRPPRASAKMLPMPGANVITTDLVIPGPVSLRWWLVKLWVLGRITRAAAWRVALWPRYWRGRQITLGRQPERNLRFWLTVRTPNGLDVGVGAPAGLCAVATSLRQPSTRDTQPSRRRDQQSRW